MKIDMYTLLGMVKDGKAPKKIKYQNEIYTTDDVEYFCYKSGNRTPLFEHIFDYYSDYDALNEEVIILDNLEEEKKIPEKLETYKDRNNDIFLDDLCYKYMPIHKDSLSFNEQVIVDKLNEVLDYLKSKGDE